MTKTGALRMALEALEQTTYAFMDTEGSHGKIEVDAIDASHKAITAIREALAQPAQEPVIGTKTWFEDGKMVTQHLTAKDIYKDPEEQEPVAWMHVQGDYEEPSWRQLDDDEIEMGWKQYPLYTTPPLRPWVGLTAEEAAECWTTSATQTWKNFEAKLKEKNNG